MIDKKFLKEFYEQRKRIEEKALRTLYVRGSSTEKTYGKEEYIRGRLFEIDRILELLDKGFFGEKERD